MKERPILFSAPMVRAILEGRKTQTRRVVKVPRSSPFRDSPTDWLVSASGGQLDTRHWHEALAKHCPHGAPGDRLWVRETWGPCEGGVVYRASENVAARPDGGKWKPSIFMPRWASRLTLEVTGVRVERLQDISDRDCEAEGVRPSVDGDGKDWLPNETGWRRTFRQLWSSINGADSWAADPWVWVVEFKRVAQEERTA